jgi:hypothetical protein
MKNFLALYLFAFTINANSQVWIDQNAVWHYDYWGVAEEGFFKLEYNQDSLVGGQTCQMIETNQHAFYMNQDGEIVHGGASPKPNEFTYVNGDTVFYWRDNQFFTLFDFGALIGDQWQIGSTNTSGDDFCNDSSFVEVLDTGTVVINSITYRTITLETTAGSALRFGGVFVERFGQIGSNYGFGTFPGTTICDTNVIVDYYQFTFKCFEDDSFTLHNPSGEDCEYLLTHLNIENLSDQALLIYPNPARDFLTVEMHGDGVIQVLDNLGQLVVEKNHSEKTFIDMSSQPVGLYFLLFKNGNTSQVKKLVKN